MRAKEKEMHHTWTGQQELMAIYPGSDICLSRPMLDDAVARVGHPDHEIYWGCLSLDNRVIIRWTHGIQMILNLASGVVEAVSLVRVPVRVRIKRLFRRGSIRLGLFLEHLNARLHRG